MESLSASILEKPNSVICYIIKQWLKPGTGRQTPCPTCVDEVKQKPTGAKRAVPKAEAYGNGEVLVLGSQMHTREGCSFEIYYKISMVSMIHKNFGISELHRVNFQIFS